jgi:serine/threonine-protein kinase
MLEEALFRKRDFAAAIREGAQIVEQRRAAGGENLAHALIKLGRSHQEAGEHRAAADAFREAAQIFRQAFAKPTDFLAQSLYNLGVVTRDGGDAQGAIAPLQEAMAIDTELWGADHFHVLGDRYNLARTLLAAGEPAEAVEQMRLVMASPARSKSEPWRQLCHEAVLGSALAEDRQDEEGERCLVEAITGLGKLGRGDDAPARQARASLVQMYERLGRTEDAARWRSGKQ